VCRKKEKQDYRTELEKKGEEKYFTMSDGTIVRVLDFNFWQRVMELLTPKHRVIYFESREKFTSTVPRKLERKITFTQMGYDIKEVVEQMGLDGQKYITLCSSTGGTILYEALARKWLTTGGTILYEALARKWLKPTGSVSLGPSMIYNIEWYVSFFSQFIPNFIIKTVFRPFVRWNLTKVYVNKNAEPEQMVKYMRAFDEADLRKSKPIIRKMRKYDGWDLPAKIDTPSVLIGASSDVMHAADNCKRVDSLMPNSYYVDLGSNKAAHEEPLIDEIYKFIQKIEEKKI